MLMKLFTFYSRLKPTAGRLACSYHEHTHTHTSLKKNSKVLYPLHSLGWRFGLIGPSSFCTISRFAMSSELSMLWNLCEAVTIRCSAASEALGTRFASFLAAMSSPSVLFLVTQCSGKPRARTFVDILK